MSGLRVIGSLDPSFAWDGRDLYPPRAFAARRPVPDPLRGAAASVEGNERSGWRIVRDPLGINKLFWTDDANGTILVAARPRRLVNAGCAFEEIRAIPRGKIIDLGSAAAEPAIHSLGPEPGRSLELGTDVDVDAIAREIRDSLDGYLAALRRAYPAARIFVCLSGGLDSSGIAVLAREHFDELVAVSFDLRRNGRESEDRRAARRLARDLGLDLLEANVDETDLLEALDLVLVEAVDWRDFNVHAALVNAAIASAVSDAVPADRESTIVLTGDLANEFLADYGPERYKDATYYVLPSLGPSQLRASLVHGLDTSHREVGVFAAWNLAVVQPYAAAVDAYLALPEAFLALKDRKERLCRAVYGQLLPNYVYLRPKVRAQLGSSGDDAGVLGACVDCGVDGVWLKKRFARLHGVDDLAALGRFIRAGRYRTELPRLGGRQ
jgi:asparagine synthetase B (glutamine-hydrolysing)